MMKNFNIEELFKIKSGDFHATKELDAGDIPLISCGETTNGFVGYYDIPKDKRYTNTITVAYNGQPLTAKYHPYEFGAKDDVAVFLPKINMHQKTLVYIAAIFNSKKWRYSYGRKCFREKMKEFNLSLPITKSGKIDKTYIMNLQPINPQDLLPPKNKIQHIQFQDINWKSYIVTELFILKRGDFHSLSNIDKGGMMTVSRIADNNGVVGYYHPPKNVKIYSGGLITVSTVSGDAFVQINDFIVTDNVVICIPKKPFKITTLFFIQLMLNQTKWRYSYGRQCYKTKFSQTKIYLPIDNDREIDERFMETVVKNTPYWEFIEQNITT